MITFINKLTVIGEAAEFERIAESITNYMRVQPGYIRSQMLRSLRNPSVYIELANWKDAESHRRAVQSDGFKAVVSALGPVAKVDPDLYTVVRELAAEG